MLELMFQCDKTLELGALTMILPLAFHSSMHCTARMSDCVFCNIVKGDLPCHKIWENDEFLAFLSIFPNTPGFSVVVPKKHYPSYAFDLPDDLLSRLTVAAKKVGKRIDKAFDDVGRTGMIYEGFGVDHVHAKLFPMHGTGNLATWKPLHAKLDTYFTLYPGYISSHDGARASDEALAGIAARIRAAEE